MKNCIRTTGLFVLGLVACGDPLANGDYEGEARFVIEGEIQSLEAEPDAESEPRQTLVGLLWHFDHGCGDQVGAQIAQVSDGAFPFGFDLLLRDQPSRDHLIALPSGTASSGCQPVDNAQGYVGIANIGVFADVDGDLQFKGEIWGRAATTGDDRLRGLAPHHLVLYAENVVALRQALQRLPEEERGILNPEQLQEGYNLMRTVCAEALTPKPVFDQIRVVTDELVDIVSMEDIEANERYCLNVS